MLVDIPQPVEDEADIVVPLSLLRCPRCAAGRAAASLLQILVVYRSATEQLSLAVPVTAVQDRTRKP